VTILYNHPFAFKWQITLLNNPYFFIFEGHAYMEPRELTGYWLYYLAAAKYLQYVQKVLSWTSNLQSWMLSQNFDPFIPNSFMGTANQNY
jgi:hypothetical protein